MTVGKRVTAGAVVVALAVSMIAPFEGLRTTAYRDVIGIPTICYGETRSVFMGQTKTAAECGTMLAMRVAEFYHAVDPCIPDDVPAPAKVAFVSLAYNIGSGGFCSSSTIQGAFRRHDYLAACNGISLFNRAGGRVVQGLINRRAIEKAACLKGLVK